jgi:hypothetical protein
MTNKKGEAPPKGTIGEALAAAPSEIERVLSDLARRQKTLDALDDRLSNLLKRIEVAMRNYFSIRISVPIGAYSMEEIGEDAYDALTFGKHDGKWQLLIESGVTGDPDSAEFTPLLSAPRDRRVAVFNGGHLENLIRDAARQIDEQISEREKAIIVGSTLVRALEPVEPEKEAP